MFCVFSPLRIRGNVNVLHFTGFQAPTYIDCGRQGSQTWRHWMGRGES